MQFQIIGIGNKKASLPPELLTLVQQHRVFSGGSRHKELVKHLLPANHQWIFIKSPMEEVFKAYEEAGEPVVVFASGDPLFYGFANTLKERYPAATISTYPYFSSIQLLAHRVGLNINELKTVSVHGRSWQALDEALIRQEALLGVLTDAEKTPAAIAERLLTWGYSNYKLVVGEDLEGAAERVQQLTLAEAAAQQFHPLNCLILQKERHRTIPFGIPDEQFSGLEGRPNMITKMPVRLCTLHALELGEKTSLWDIGFCTGSVSIEAKLRFPHLNLHAFEKREECGRLMLENQQRFGAPGIVSHIGDFFETDLQHVPLPDAVFIGGHGGRLKALMQQIDRYLLAGGIVVINAVQEATALEFEEEVRAIGWQLAESLKLKVDSHNEITVLKAVKPI